MIRVGFGDCLRLLTQQIRHKHNDAKRLLVDCSDLMQIYENIFEAMKRRGSSQLSAIPGHSTAADLRRLELSSSKRWSVSEVSGVSKKHRDEDVRRSDGRRSSVSRLHRTNSAQDSRRKPSPHLGRRPTSAKAYEAKTHLSDFDLSGGSRQTGRSSTIL